MVEPTTGLPLNIKQNLSFDSQTKDRPLKRGQYQKITIEERNQIVKEALRISNHELLAFAKLHGLNLRSLKRWIDDANENGFRTKLKPGKKPANKEMEKFVINLIREGKYTHRSIREITKSNFPEEKCKFSNGWMDKMIKRARMVLGTNCEINQYSAQSTYSSTTSEIQTSESNSIFENSEEGHESLSIRNSNIDYNDSSEIPSESTRESAAHPEHHLEDFRVYSAEDNSEILFLNYLEENEKSEFIPNTTGMDFDLPFSIDEISNFSF